MSEVRVDTAAVVQVADGLDLAAAALSARTAAVSAAGAATGDADLARVLARVVQAWQHAARSLAEDAAIHAAQVRAAAAAYERVEQAGHAPSRRAAVPDTGAVRPR
jgi:hypothetical protein